MNKTNDTLPGVNCEVKDCVFHCVDNACAAPSIRVSCDRNAADCKSDTACDTFCRNGDCH